MRQNFNLPLSNLKRESSFIEKVKFTAQKTENGETVPNIYQLEIDNRIHRNGVILYLYIAAYRKSGTTDIVLVGNAIKLEEMEIYYNSPSRFFLAFSTTRQGDQLLCNLQLYNTDGTDAELWIEKISIMDSDFDYNKGWLNPNDPDNILDGDDTGGLTPPPPEIIEVPPVISGNDSSDGEFYYSYTEDYNGGIEYL